MAITEIKKNDITAVLVGCGGMAGAWIQAVLETGAVRLVGCVDLNEEAARNRAAYAQIKDPIIGTDLDEVLTKAKPDVVFDCTIPEAHYAVTLTALKHGCHVLGEKPLATSMAQAREMVATAEATGKIYAVIQNRRYNAEIRRLKHFLEQGTLGELTTLNCDFFLGPRFGGFREQMNHVLLLDMAIHTFDAARLICGGDAVSVYCKEWNPSGSWFKHGASAVAIFEMSNGVIYTYRGSWCALGSETTWESDWRILGTQGSARWDGGGGLKAEVLHQEADKLSLKPVEWPDFDAADKVGGHAGLIREFTDCVLNGGTPETVASDNINSLAMVLAAVESAETGKRVDIRT